MSHCESDREYQKTIRLLRESSESFRKYEQDVIQSVVDTLTSVNLFAEAEKRTLHGISKSETSYPGNESSFNVFTKIQEINKNLMAKIREI